MSASAQFEMDLQQLVEAVSKHIPASRMKDVKTAVRVLAKALGFTSPGLCPPAAYNQPIDKLYELLDQAQVAKGDITKRNTKNNISLLFRTATKHQLFSNPKAVQKAPGRPKPKHDWRKRTKRKGAEASTHQYYYLRKDEWPSHLMKEYEALVLWAVSPMVKGRPADQKKRASTIKLYKQGFSAFFGFLHHVQNVELKELRFNFVFDFDKLKAFVDWHVNVLHDRVTQFIVMYVGRVATLLRQYRPDPTTLELVKTLKRELGKPKKHYNKREVWVPLTDLDAIGQALWPTRMPTGSLCTGKGYARAACMSLIIRLLCRRPFRQRNVREMQIDENVYKTTEGSWMIRFVGEALKIEQKNGQENDFELPFPTDLVPQLETFLSTWRPLLGGSSRHLFLNIDGKPFYSESTFNAAFGRPIYSHTGKRFHPHLVRTVWATEYIKETHDFYGAAIMLNDTLDAVIKNYAEVLDEGTARKADEWLQSKISAKTQSHAENGSKEDLPLVIRDVLSVLTTDHQIGGLFHQNPDLSNKLREALKLVLNSNPNTHPWPVSTPPLSKFI